MVAAKGVKGLIWTPLYRPGDEEDLAQVRIRLLVM